MADHMNGPNKYDGSHYINGDCCECCRWTDVDDNKPVKHTVFCENPKYNTYKDTDGNDKVFSDTSCQSKSGLCRAIRMLCCGLFCCRKDFIAEEWENCMHWSMLNGCYYWLCCTLLAP